MSESLLEIPDACRMALAAIEADPMELPEVVAAHVRSCAACGEARVQWLAQEEFPAVLVPNAYYDQLSDRILRKLPNRRPLRPRHHIGLWLAAAGLVLAVGVGGFLAGKANRTPMVEATLPKAPMDLHEVLPDTPFNENDDAVSQLSTMSPEEADEVLKRLDAPQVSRP